MQALKIQSSAAMTNARRVLREHLDSLKQWSPGQRRMLAVIVVLLLMNVLLVVRSSTQTDQVAPEKLSRRSLDQGTAEDEATGAIYIRWGRTECPPQASLVYEGVAGGRQSDDPGGGANYLCLPLDPDFATGKGSKRSFVYGTEYEELDFISGKSVQNHNVPCAMCQSVARRHVMVLPAKSTCYSGWHLEYHGVLVTENAGSKHNKVYECLDHEPQADQAGYRDETGAQMLSVSASCGALPCPPYEENPTLTCAVCTK